MGAMAQSPCADYSPLQMHAPETPPCCKIQAAQNLGPAVINTARAEKPLLGLMPISGPGFAVNAFERKTPLVNRSPPGALNSYPSIN